MSHDKIKDTVNKYGIITTLKLFGGNKDIIKQAYIDNPESYLDYLIGNIITRYGSINFTDNIQFMYGNTTIFLCKKYEYELSNGGKIIVDDFIWNFFFLHIMDYNNEQTRTIIKSWLEKHIPSTKHLTPISKSHEYFQSNLSVKTSNYVI
jgi:hypothetical protein